MSSDNLQALEDWAQSLVASLDVKARRKLLRRLGIELRKANAKRIRNQKNADGGSYAPRRKPKKVEEIKFLYRDKSGDVSERKVHSARGHKTYLFGHDYTRGAFRTFRRDRIVEIYSKNTVIAKKAQRMLLGMTKRKILGIESDGFGARIGYEDNSAMIAGVHQHGKTIKVSKNGPRVRYPERQLLGVSQSDQKAMRALLLKHLSEKS